MAKIVFSDIKLQLTNLYLARRKQKWFKLFSSDKFITPNFRIAQYFFTSDCTKDLVDRLNEFQNPCCLCTPRLGKEWLDRGRIVRVLDIDKRFSFLPGYRYYDLKNPKVLNEEFDVIIMDPNITCGETILLKAINTLSKRNYNQKLLILYHTQNNLSFLMTFKDYNLHPTGYYPKYCNIKEQANKNFMFYANFEFP